MDLVVLSANETPYALRALRDVVASNGTITAAERRFIEVIGELHGTTVDVDTMASIAPGEVAEVITEPHRRKRVVQLASIAAMVEGDVTKQLSLLPEGTIGREFWEHCAKNRFSVPGEKGGIPERMVFHDFGHVLAGYDTRPESEIQQGAFQGGFVREDGFAFLMFAIIQFHLGVKVTPVSDGYAGLFDVPKVLRAAQRGAACKVDLSDHWDPFAVADAPLEQIRAEYGVPAL
jgi:ubiquinone biosynthesis protein Coq4